jgi:hypothetical protein
VKLGVTTETYEQLNSALREETQVHSLLSVKGLNFYYK